MAGVGGEPEDNASAGADVEKTGAPCCTVVLYCVCTLRGYALYGCALSGCALSGCALCSGAIQPYPPMARKYPRRRPALWETSRFPPKHKRPPACRRQTRGRGRLTPPQADALSSLVRRVRARRESPGRVRRGPGDRRAVVREPVGRGYRRGLSSRETPCPGRERQAVAQPSYVCTRPKRSCVPQMPLRRHSSWTIWLWSTKRFTSGP